MSGIITWIKNKINGNHYETIDELRKRGVTIGEGCHIFNTRIDGGHGFLVEIGNNVTLTNMTILAHDASTKMYLGYSKVGSVIIGDNVFAGYGSIILPGVTVGNNVIIGAGAVVRENIPDNSVVSGNPATVICKTDEYIARNKEKLESGNVPVFDTPWRQKTDEMKADMKKALRDKKGFDV